MQAVRFKELMNLEMVISVISVQVGLDLEFGNSNTFGIIQKPRCEDNQPELIGAHVQTGIDY